MFSNLYLNLYRLTNILSERQIGHFLASLKLAVSCETAVMTSYCISVTQIKSGYMRQQINIGAEGAGDGVWREPRGLTSLKCPCPFAMLLGGVAADSELKVLCAGTCKAAYRLGIGSTAAAKVPCAQQGSAFATINFDDGAAVL